jgi:uncharacterized membrane protein
VDIFLIPNFHVILIHFPLALLGIGVAIELFSFLWRRSSFRAAGQWMILLGTLSAIPAATSGIYAFRSVLGHGNEMDSMVEYKQASGFTDADWHFARNHILFNSVATGAALVCVVIWLGASDGMRKLLRIPILLALMGTMGLMSAGAWQGGEMVFRQGFGVVGKMDSVPNPASKPHDLRDKIEYFAPPGEMHLLMAGLVFAMAAAALGLSIRRAVTTETVVVQRVPPTYISSEKEGPTKPISLLQALNDPGDEIPITKTTPAARFWLLAALLTIAAVFSGLWFAERLAAWPWIINRDLLMKDLKQIPNPKQARIGMHIVFGASILVLVLILALLTRFAPRSRVLLSGFSLLLVLVMAAQVWVGVMLTYDGDEGSLSRFRTAAEVNASQNSDESTPATQPAVTTRPITPGE